MSKENAVGLSVLFGSDVVLLDESIPALVLCGLVRILRHVVNRRVNILFVVG